MAGLGPLCKGDELVAGLWSQSPQPQDHDAPARVFIPPGPILSPLNRVEVGGGEQLNIIQGKYLTPKHSL